MDLIVGGGKFGCQAVEYLRKNHRDFTLVDKDPNCLAVREYGIRSSTKVGEAGEFFVKGDLSEALVLIMELKPEYVFPTAPTHIAAELAKTKFGLEPWTEPINRILVNLPQAVVLHVGRGNLIVSFNRDKDCFEKCDTPEVCPSTKIRKPCTMDRLMKFAYPEAFLLISHQMSPGMGALKGSEILEFFSWVEKQEKFVVATACDCHGVFTGFKKTVTL